MHHVYCGGHQKVRGRCTISMSIDWRLACCISEHVESVRPPEILCRVLQFAVGSDGVKALLPFTHVSARWRGAALGDSSLWTTIYLQQTTVPLLDMALAHAGNRLLTVYIDHHDLDRFAALWKIIDRIEELHYFTHLRQLVPLLSSFGPAPNLKVLDLRPVLTVGREEPIPLISLPVIFSGCLSSLRDLTLANTVAWPAGLFKSLTSFEYSTPHYPISPVHVLDALRESPSIEFIRLAGSCSFPSGLKLRRVVLRSLVKCTLAGLGITSLIRFMTVPASALVTLTGPWFEPGAISPKFDDLSTARGLHVLDEVSAISFSINDNAVRLRAESDSGGAFDVEVNELSDISRDPIFVNFVLSAFEFGRTRPGFKTIKELTLDIDRGRIWAALEATCFALDVLGLIHSFPEVEDVTLRGLPPMDLSLILKCLCGDPRVELLCQKIERLHIGSTPLHSPRSLLVDLDKFLTERKRAGEPLRSFTVKVKCEMLIPATDHCAFLTSWGGLVEEDVRLEYERFTVKKLPRRRRRNYEDEDDWGDRMEDDENDESECEEIGVGDPDGGCVGWDSWPEKWPKTMGK